MLPAPPLRVAVLVDLPRTPQSGGHVKCWERLAASAAGNDLSLDLTVYFSGTESTEILGPRARFRHLPQIFSTANLKFLPYMPDTTDLSPWHPRLARELPQYDVIHTTDGFFAFARTAERISRRDSIPLVTSFHTDTPAYARIFTRSTIEKIFGGMPPLRRKLIEDWKIPERQGLNMERKLKRHVGLCRYAIVTRGEDHALAESVLGKDNVYHLRLGVDRAMFGPHKRDRAGIERDYNIPAEKIIVLFVGRVDAGKNIPTLAAAMETLIADGAPLHLIVAGVGPAAEDVKRRLGHHATLPGFVRPEELARLYASVDVLALCSEVEIRSMAGVEAMASGCPALVSHKSDMWELYNHTPAMQPVSSGTLAWADAIRGFVRDPERHKQMRFAATDYTRDHLAPWQTILAEDLFAVWQRAGGIRQQAAA